MRMTVETTAISKRRYDSPRYSFTALVSSRPAICSVAVTVKVSPATSLSPRRLNSSLRDLHSASAPFTAASAWPSASASVSFERLWKRDVVDGFAAWAIVFPLWLGLGPPWCVQHLGGPT